LEAKVKITG